MLLTHLQRRSLCSMRFCRFQQYQHHSHSHAIANVVTLTYDNINKNELTGLVFLDLKKAFGTVSHSILLRKLNHYGIRGQAHNLLSSYLEDRKQYVTDDNITSTTESIEYGIWGTSRLYTRAIVIFDIY